ncbi:hypothetical protein MKZ38_010425 [Zalerion maritima]|uniref:Vacuolar protein sorting-associated protein 28 n=1 Tax=Zalerion maritima TaxID=339359 RepID=A0AAD5RT58_9PEZI|nr:hypothetical protein MKZ38_010425 [Zalerion maritima]
MQPYAPVLPSSYVPNTSNATINMDQVRELQANHVRNDAELQEVKLAETRADQDLWDSLAEIFSIIVTLDELEKAFLKDAIPEAEYTEICERALKQYRSILADDSVARAFVGLEEFKAEWGLEAPRATERIRVGMPSTTMTASSSAPHQAPAATGITSGALIAEATQDFITFLDALRLGMLAKDQLHPLLTDVIQSANKVTGGADFENRGKIVQWLITLNQMQASEELSEQQARQLEMEITQAYNGFKSILT